MSPAELGDPVWHEVTDFPFDGRWYRQEQDFYVVRVDSWEVSIDGLRRESSARSIDGHRWWSLAELTTTDETVLPAGAARRCCAASWSA